MGEILVGVDASTASRRAVDRAVLEARTGGGAVRALHVWDQPSWVADVTGLGFGVATTPAETERLAQRLLEEAVGACAPGEVPIVTETVRGDARDVLVKRSRDAPLLVVGGHGLGEVRSALLGSVTLHCLHHAACPLMVVPGSDASPHAYQHVIVGIDGSPASRSAMRWALAAAQRHQCPLVVVHGWLSTTIPGRPAMSHLPALAEFERESGEWMDKEVAEVLPDYRGVQVRTELSHSTASWALLETTGPDDLLVLGSRGRGGFTSLLLGSTASQCVQRAPGVVVVVHRQGSRTRSP